MTKMVTKVCNHFYNYADMDSTVFDRLLPLHTKERKALTVNGFRGKKGVFRNPPFPVFSDYKSKGYRKAAMLTRHA